jgi:hypothetical protein
MGSGCIAFGTELRTTGVLKADFPAMTQQGFKEPMTGETKAAPSEKKPTLNLEHQSTTAKELLAFGKQIMSGTIHARTVFTQKDYAFFALADKSLATFEGIGVLCEHQLVDDGFALIRVLVEGIINAAFVVYSDDQTASDYANFPYFRDWIEFKELEAVAPEITNSRPRSEVDEMRCNYEKVESRYRGHKADWCDQNLFKRASTIDAAVGHGYNVMRTLVNLPWRKASTYVHGTAAAIEARVHHDDSGAVIHRKYDPKEAGGVLFMANMAVFSLLVIVDLRLGKNNEKQWRSLYERWGGDEPAKRGEF